MVTILVIYLQIFSDEHALNTIIFNYELICYHSEEHEEESTVGTALPPLSHPDVLPMLKQDTLVCVLRKYLRHSPAFAVILTSIVRGPFVI